MSDKNISMFLQKNIFEVHKGFSSQSCWILQNLIYFFNMSDFHFPLILLLQRFSKKIVNNIFVDIFGANI